MASKFEKKLAQKTAENPAMMFISQAEEAAPEKGKKTLKVSSRRVIETPEQETPLRDTPLQAEETSAAPIRPAPLRREAKTRRLQLLLQPSLYEAIRARAEEEGLSVNEEIGELLRSALDL